MGFSDAVSRASRIFSISFTSPKSSSILETRLSIVTSDMTDGLSVTTATFAFALVGVVVVVPKVETDALSSCGIHLSDIAGEETVFLSAIFLVFLERQKGQAF